MNWIGITSIVEEYKCLYESQLCKEHAYSNWESRRKVFQDFCPNITLSNRCLAFNCPKYVSYLQRTILFHQGMFIVCPFSQQGIRTSSEGNTRGRRGWRIYHSHTGEMHNSLKCPWAVSLSCTSHPPTLIHILTDKWRYTGATVSSLL